MRESFLKAGDYMNHGYKASRHPINYILDFPEFKQRKNVILHYSIYSYEPHSFRDDREEFEINFNLLNEDWLKEVISTLLPNQELAFHSEVNIDNEIYHMPMIDLGGRSSEIKNISIIEELSGLQGINFDVYASGRSYHVYGDKLLNHNEWVKFMGGVLLLNIPGKYKIVDTRWVGHRLVGGYASLRWSNNTTQYKRYPVHIGSIKDIINKNTHN